MRLSNNNAESANRSCFCNTSQYSSFRNCCSCVRNLSLRAICQALVNWVRSASQEKRPAQQFRTRVCPKHPGRGRWYRVLLPQARARDLPQDNQGSQNICLKQHGQQSKVGRTKRFHILMQYLPRPCQLHCLSSWLWSSLAAHTSPETSTPTLRT